MKFAVAIKMPTGKILYYTGRAGEHYLSSKIEDAFFGYSQEGARRKAEQLASVRTSGLAADHKALTVSESEVLETEGGSCD